MWGVLLLIIIRVTYGFVNLINFNLEVLPPLPLPNQRRFADAGEFGGLRVGVVFEELHRVVELLGVEFWRTPFAEIRVGRAGDRLALLGALHDHVALELGERQQHVAQQRVHRVV